VNDKRLRPSDVIRTNAIQRDEHPSNEGPEIGPKREQGSKWESLEETKCECSCHNPGPWAKEIALELPEASLLTKSKRDSVMDQAAARASQACADCCKASQLEEKYASIDKTARRTIVLGYNQQIVNIDRVQIRIPDVDGRGLGVKATEQQRWAVGYTYGGRLMNADHGKKIQLDSLPAKVFTTQTAAVRACLTELSGKAPSYSDAPPKYGRKSWAYCPSKRRRKQGRTNWNGRTDQATYMNRIPWYAVVQTQGLARPGNGWLRRKLNKIPRKKNKQAGVATPAEETPESTNAANAANEPGRHKSQQGCNPPNQGREDKEPKTRLEEQLKGYFDTPTINDVTLRNCVCKVMEQGMNMAGWSDIANPEIKREGPISHDLTDRVLEYLFGWHLDRQTFTSSEEGEMDNAAATMVIARRTPNGVSTTPAERAILSKEAWAQFVGHDKAYKKLEAQGDHKEALTLFREFQARVTNHLMYPHATHELVKEQQAALYCLEPQGGLWNTAGRGLIASAARVQQAKLIPSKKATVTPHSIAAGVWQAVPVKTHEDDSAVYRQRKQRERSHLGASRRAALGRQLMKPHSTLRRQESTKLQEEAEEAKDEPKPETGERTPPWRTGRRKKGGLILTLTTPN